jgi:putative transcriptional regulator
MKGGLIMKVKLGRNTTLTGKTDWARLKSMSPREARAAADADPENPPLTAAELARLQPVPDPRAIRESLGLSQREFAEVYQLSLATIRDWEQGRYQPDQAARTLLRLIAREPKLVEATLR